MAVMDSDGTYIIKGRVSDALRFKCFGDVIYPAPIENALSKHPDIKDCAVSQNIGWYPIQRINDNLDYIYPSHQIY